MLISHLYIFFGEIFVTVFVPFFFSLGKAKFTWQKGAQTQQAREADHRSSFLFLIQWALPPVLGLVEFGVTICYQLANATLGIWGWGR
jgi:hypothetical protein